MTRKLIAPIALILAVGAVLAASAAAKHHAAPIKTAANAKLGTILVNAHGRTLYHLQGETSSKLKCLGSCVALWPPATASSLAGSSVHGVKLTRRSDSHKLQLTYRNEPLYTFANDHKAGDTNGEGFAGIWHAIVKKAPAAPAPAPAPAPSMGYGY